MKIVVLGLGSMGKRRIRCLQTLGVQEIIGVDSRADRRFEACQLYNVAVGDSFEAALKSNAIDAVIISLPPGAHVSAMNTCIKYRVPFFVEASVVDAGLSEIITKTRELDLLAAPSTTLHFHPAIQTIAKIVKCGQLGKISNIMLHSGQYLPDWHSYEKVSEYYVSSPETGGAREIVPFEMTWFTELFGFPRRVAATFRKTIEIEGAEYIDDTYNCLLDFGSFLATVTVDVVSRLATRRLVINGSKQQLTWSWDDPKVYIYDGAKNSLISIPYEVFEAAPGYNQNISEKMYVDEIQAFLNAIQEGVAFPNTLEADHRVLKLLYQLERSDKLSCFLEVLP